MGSVIDQYQYGKTVKATARIIKSASNAPLNKGSIKAFNQTWALRVSCLASTALLLVPYVIFKTATTRLWPLGLSLLLCFLLGTGGTTPIPRAILGGAFDILTLDRFTFWGTILILPFTGFLLEGLIHGRSGQELKAFMGRGFHYILVSAFFLSTVGLAVFAAILPTIQPTQPRFIDPAPIVQFMEQDEHDRWRYLTLGFGDQFAYLSSQTTALSVDGNYHSVRRLPDLTRFSVERLENAKYLGVPGLGSLQQFLINADRYELKYVFSNDDFYDPLLHFTGWTRLNRLPNGVTVWEKPDVTPLLSVQPRRDIQPIQTLMWGVLPPTVLAAALTIFVFSALKRNFGRLPGDFRFLSIRPAGKSKPLHVGLKLFAGLVAMSLIVTLVIWTFVQKANISLSAEQTIEAYLDDLDFRRFEQAYERLDPLSRPEREEALFNWRWRGGLLASYGKLQGLKLSPVGEGGQIAQFDVELEWLTALGMKYETREMTTLKREGVWYISSAILRPVQAPARLQRGNEVTWNVVGRRQPRFETDLHRDRLDRPRVAIHDVRLVEHEGRFSVVGALSNTDVDPAMTSIFSDLLAEDESLVRSSVGYVTEQRLLPAETSGFRIDFEGILSLEDEIISFDPKLFIPPELDEKPTGISMDARALVIGKDLYRAVSLNNVKITNDQGTPLITGLAVNNGTETASIIKITSLLYDEMGRAVWTDAHFVETNVYPGQSAPFSFSLPKSQDVSVLIELPNQDIAVNGSTQQIDMELAKADTGTIRLSNIPGYRSLRLHVSTMTFDPLF